MRKDDCGRYIKFTDSSDSLVADGSVANEDFVDNPDVLRTTFGEKLGGFFF